MKRIRSRSNPLFRSLSDLAHSARERRHQGLSLIEGVHLCEAYLAVHGPPLQVIVSPDALEHPEVQGLMRDLEPSCVVLENGLFSSLSTLQHAVGLAFLIQTPRPDLPERLTGDLVYLDTVQDPGNVGALLRTCAAAGLDRVVLSPGTAFAWSPKVLRAAMGAHFHLALHEGVSWSALGPRLAVPVLGTRPREATVLFDARLEAPVCWVFGNEGEGVGEEVSASVTDWIAIPQAKGVESLNVAASAAVCLFEQRRQRRLIDGVG